MTFVFDEVGANSLKIAVTESDGETECYVEVEKWDFGNEVAYLWAKIPTISNITDTDIYLYYDNDHADNVAQVGLTNSVPAENVWDSDFEIVYHMRDDPDNANVRDSTDNDIDGSKRAANQPIVSVNGMIDDAQDFDGVNDWIKKAGAPMPLVFTWTSWVKAGTLGEGSPVYRKIVSYTNRPLLAYAVSTDDWYMVTAGGLFAIVSDPQANVEGNWRFLVGRYDGTNVFLDVYSTAGLVGSDTAIKALLYDSANFVMGQQGDDTRRWTGLIDETRISKIVRSEEWIKATFETGLDDLLDFGAQEEYVPMETPAYLFGAGFNGSIAYVDLRWETNLTAINFFEVQNSTDKIAWDHLGTSTTNNYTDLQVVNGTQRYYRIRACNFTGAAWDNSTWTDIDFETVYYEVGGAPGPSPSLFPGLAIGIALLIIGAIYAVEKRR